MKKPLITFTFSEESKSGKTKIWDVMSAKGALIGEVKWFGTWRRYAFFPWPDTIFDAVCLTEISKFCHEKTIAHKEKQS